MRSSRLLVSSCLIGIGAALGYSWVTRSEAPDPGPSPTMQATGTPSDRGPATSRSAPPPDGAPSSPQQQTQISIDTLLADAQSDDEYKRSAAIIALGDAPKAQALPALQRAVDVSSSEGDRHLALRSLYKLAVEQGDEDLRIRDTLRSAIYHSDDEGVAQSAQAFAEDLDVVLAAPTR